MKTFLGLTWMDSAKFYVVPFGLVLLGIVALRPRSGSSLVGRVAFGATVVALGALIAGTAAEFWLFDWGSYAEPADAPNSATGGRVHAVASIVLSVALVPFAIWLGRSGTTRWWTAALLVLAAPPTIFLSPAFPVPGVAWLLAGLTPIGSRAR